MVETKPLVSIAMCTYNGEKYIRQQLDSILNQTYRNLEIVIVDDKSDDRTFEIIKEYAGKDRRIKYFQNKVNLGFNKNFENAIRLTTGGYIAISDQDDVWLPEKIATLVNHIGDNWLVFSNSVYIGDKQGKLLSKSCLSVNSYKSILLENIVTGHTTLFTREFAGYVLPFPKKGFYDWWMGFIALYHKKLIYCDQVLTQYRVHNTSIVRRCSTSEKKLRRHVIKTTNDMLSAFAGYQMLSETDRQFISNLSSAYQRTCRLKRRSFLLVRLLANNYREFFYSSKARSGLSALNFAFKYVGKVKSYAMA